MFLTIVVVIAIISILWALWSLREALQHKEAATSGARETLRKGKVIYQHDAANQRTSSESDGDSSSSLSA